MTLVRKKIVFILPALYGGGAERVVINLINFLDRKKYEISLIVALDLNSYGVLLDDVKIYCLGKKSSSDYFNLIVRLKNILKDINPDTVVSFSTYTNIMMVLASWLLGKTYKLILSMRNNPLKDHKNLRGNIERIFIKLFFNHAHIVTTNSEFIRTLMVRDFNIPQHKVVNIYNPLDIERIEALSSESINHKFLNRDHAVVIAAGRLSGQKRFDRLLRVFSKVAAQVPQARLIILGQGEKENELKEQARLLAIDGIVDFVGFQVNAYAWFSRADVYVLCSDYEGFPNALLEAMTCRVPVVAGDCESGPNEIIINGQNGFLVGVSHEDAYAQSIIRLFSDKALRERMAEAGYASIQKFRVESIGVEFERIL